MRGDDVSPVWSVSSPLKSDSPLFSARTVDLAQQLRTSTPLDIPAAVSYTLRWHRDPTSLAHGARWRARGGQSSSINNSRPAPLMPA